MSDWNHGLFGCMDHGVVTCLYAFILPNCAVASARTTYDTSNWVFNCLCVGPVVGRNIVREGYGIDGTCLTDVLMMYFCMPCGIAQLLNETKTRGPVTKQAAADNADWSTGLCSCFSDFGSCCYVMLFPQCANASTRTDFDNSNWLLNCCCVTPALVRNLVREAYGIRGTCMTDIICSMCCLSYSMCQVYREVKTKGKITAQRPSGQGMH